MSESTDMSKQENNKGPKHRKKLGWQQGSNQKSQRNENLKGSYFKVGDPDGYNKTLKAIIEYVQTTYTSGAIICKLLENQEEVIFPTPTQPTDGNGATIPEENLTFVQKEQLWSDIKTQERNMAHYKDNKIHVVGLILGQCQEAMRHKLEGLGDWNMIKRNPI